MLLALTLAALATIPAPSPVLRDEVTAIERNHFYDEDGRQVFVQFIFSDFDGASFRVVAWRLDHGEFIVTENPPSVVWIEENRLRHVTGESWRETHLQYDPELRARETLPTCHRRGLSK